MRQTSAQSPAELAERTGRKQPNLSRTLKTMEHYGLMQLSRHKRKLVPRVRKVEIIEKQRVSKFQLGLIGLN